GNESAKSSALSITTLKVPDTTAPSIPQGLEADNIAQTSMEMAWAASSDDTGVTGYKVFRDGTQIATVTTTSFSDSSLSPETTYSYQVSAFDEAGNESAKSSAISVTTLEVPDTTPPSVPQELSADNITQTSARLTWEPSTDNESFGGYKVFRDGELIGTVENPLFNDFSLSPGTTYSYQVSAFDTSNNGSAKSVALAVTTLEEDINEAPVLEDMSQKIIHEGEFISFIISAIDPDNDPLVLTVTLEGGAPLSSIGAEFIDHGDGTGTFSWTPSFDQGDLEYELELSVSDGELSDAGSMVIAVMDVDIEAPAVPQGLRVDDVTQTTADIGWIASTDNIAVTGYKVFRDGDHIATVETPSFSDASLAANTTYSYQVSAFDAEGSESDKTAALSVTTLKEPDTIPPSIPQGLEADNITQLSARLTWEPSTDNESFGGYKVFRDGVLIGTVENPLFNDFSLSPGTTYSYQVSAFDVSNNESAKSSAISVTTLKAPDITPPSIPQGLEADNITPASVELAWVASTDDEGVTGYKVFRDGDHIATVETPAFGDSSLSPETTYSYQVSAFDEAGNESSKSAALSVTTLKVPDIASPSVPQGLQAGTITETTATLSWEASSDNVGVTGYKVFRNGSVVATITGTSYADQSLEPDTTYMYQVSAFDAENNESAKSLSIEIKTLPLEEDLPCEEVIGEGNFNGCYYNNEDLTDLRVERVDEKINFDWGYGRPHPDVSSSRFSVSWTGRFLFEDGSYTFDIDVNDGIRLYIDGELILNKWERQRYTQHYMVVKKMTPGHHVIKVEYYDYVSSAVAKVDWMKSSDPENEKLMVDNADDEFSVTGFWSKGTYYKGYIGSNYSYNAAGYGNDVAKWDLSVVKSGKYQVFASWAGRKNHATNAKYEIFNMGSIQHPPAVNQQESPAGQWYSLGVYDFTTGPVIVTLSDDANGYVVADAIKLVPIE
ncbi:MAG: hypothetical protein KC684_04530, partial [Candidatus Omnitrophica bacterium]|nr:hypothetical protein [Candidatus Omnitrophota bacterium]